MLAVRWYLRFGLSYRDVEELVAERGIEVDCPCRELVSTRLTIASSSPRSAMAMTARWRKSSGVTVSLSSRFARRLVGDHARAEEVSQDVFVRLWERSDRFDPQRGVLRAFLLALTHGRALDVVRSDVARRRREERDVARTNGSAYDAGEQVVARTVGDAVRNALSLIPEPERRAVELAYFGGHSYRTVASMLDEPEGTVKSRIRSGLARLRSALADQDLQDA